MSESGLEFEFRQRREMDLARQQQQPAVPYGQPGAGGGNMMGGEYFDLTKDQITWQKDANARYNAEHRIDPNTGEVLGPMGPAPAGVAPIWQAAHNQAVWRARQRRASSAANYMQGALGLLQSYRPGGGAALESGIYQNLASVELSRAQLLEPLDLLGDYRRDEAARARQKANRMSEMGLAIQGVAAAASLFAPMLAPAALGGAATAQGAQTAQSGNASIGAPANGGYDGLGVAPAMTPIGGGGGGGAGAPIGAPAGGGYGGGQAGGGPAGGGQALPSRVDSNAPAGGGGAPAPGGGAGAGSPGGGMGAPGQGGMGGPGVGADGDFTPTAYARAASVQQDLAQSAFLSVSMANILASDNFIPSFSAMVDARMRQRGVA